MSNDNNETVTISSSKLAARLDIRGEIMKDHPHPKAPAIT
jgi:hypothetical protein